VNEEEERAVYGDGVDDLPARLLREGHYLRVTRPRQHTGERVRPDEGFARVERVELIEEPGRVIDAERAGTRMPETLLAVFCRGVPGPLLVGGVQVRRRIDPARMVHDLATPNWSHLPPVAQLPGARLVEGAAPDPPIGEEPAALPPGSPRRAAFFPRPAAGLRAGEYFRLTGERHPAATMGIDEGFGRIEAVEHLEGPSALNHSAGTMVILTVGGLLGVLAVPGEQELDVLIDPHLERAIMEERYPWERGPYFPVRGARRLGGGIDRAPYPPAPDGEQEAYPSGFGDPRVRELSLYGRKGFRAVPLSALPWPGRLHKCPHESRFATLLAGFPGVGDASEAASAELFLQLADADFAACRYHEPDWPTIAAVALEVMEADPADFHAAAERVRADPRIAAKDRDWAESLFTDPLMWDDGSDAMSGGRHRLCGMRAAGVATCPVEGLALERARHPSARPAADHARDTLAAYRASTQPRPTTVAATAGSVFARYRAWRRRRSPGGDG
jgi:hypothetical protein